MRSSRLFNFSPPIAIVEAAVLRLERRESVLDFTLSWRCADNKDIFSASILAVSLVLDHLPREFLFLPVLAQVRLSRLIAAKRLVWGKQFPYLIFFRSSEASSFHIYHFSFLSHLLIARVKIVVDKERLLRNIGSRINNNVAPLIPSHDMLALVWPLRLDWE